MSIINPNQLQNQFQTLHTSKSNLSQEIQRIDNLRSIQTQNLSQIRTAHRNLEEKYRLASSTAGIDSKKRTMLREEKVRLETCIRDDAERLKMLSEEVKVVEGERMERRTGFVKEMEGCNDELGDALRRFEESEFGCLLDDASCRFLVQFLQEKVNANHGDEWGKVLESMRSHADRFRNAMDALDAQRSRHAEVQEKTLALRHTVQTKNKEALGDAELDELERLWGQQQRHQTDDDDELHLVEDVDVHHGDEVVLGAAPTTDLEQQSYDEAMNAVEKSCTGMEVQHGNFNNHASDEVTGQNMKVQQPANMHLFYGEILYGNEATGTSGTETAGMNDSVSYSNDHEEEQGQGQKGSMYHGEPMNDLNGIRQ